MTPAAKFSVTASETRTRSVNSSRPRGSFKLIVTPFFSTLWLLNPPPSSSPRRSSTNGGAPRRMSQRPSLVGSSTRMTSAPNAASTRVAPAPASWPVRSQIRMWESGVERTKGGMTPIESYARTVVKE